MSSQPSQGSCQQAPQLTTARWQNEGDVSGSRSWERKHRSLASNTLDQELDENQICRQQESASRAHHPLATYPVEHLILQSQAAKNTITGSRDRVYMAAQSSLRNYSKECSTFDSDNNQPWLEPHAPIGLFMLSGLCSRRLDPLPNENGAGKKVGKVTQ